MSTSLDTQHVPTGGTPARWDRFRILLEDQRGDCVRRREEALVECAQPSPDPVAQSRVGTLQQTIAEIDAALARIEAGTYGVCVHCGASIPEERLELRPYAGACVSCTSTR